MKNRGMGSWCIYEKDKLFLIWWGPHPAKSTERLSNRKKVERVKYNVRKTHIDKEFLHLVYTFTNSNYYIIILYLSYNYYHINIGGPCAISGKYLGLLNILSRFQSL